MKKKIKDFKRKRFEFYSVSDGKLMWVWSAGDSQPMDVCSVHHNNTFLRYSVSLLGYGFYGDLLADSETKRWLGPARYDLAGTSALQSLRLHIEGIQYSKLSLWDFFFADKTGK